MTSFTTDLRIVLTGNTSDSGVVACYDCGNTHTDELDVTPEHCTTFCKEGFYRQCFRRIDRAEYELRIEQLFYNLDAHYQYANITRGHNIPRRSRTR
jgi:hypothetical protein